MNLREWVREYPYTSATLAAGVLFVGGIALVVHRISGPTGSAPQAWGGGLTAFSDPSSYEPNPVLSTFSEPTIGTSYTTPFLPIPALQEPGDEQKGDSLDDLIALITSLSTPPQEASLAEPVDIQSAYAFIPQGLIALQAPAAGRTQEEQALYEYGNEVGSYIRSFESQHPNMPQILDEQARDRYNKEKGDRLRQLGNDFVSLGTRLEAIERVPGSAVALHSALSKSYQEVGAALARVPDAKSDEAFLAAIDAYSASLGTFSKRFVALADFFAISNVRFSSSDSGSIFTFSFSGGL